MTNKQNTKPVYDLDIGKAEIIFVFKFLIFGI